MQKIIARVKHDPSAPLVGSNIGFHSMNKNFRKDFHEFKKKQTMFRHSRDFRFYSV